MQVWPLGWEDPLKKGMAPHFSVLARKIPWREEPGGFQSLGLQELDMTERLMASMLAQMVKNIICWNSNPGCDMVESSWKGLVPWQKGPQRDLSLSFCHRKRHQKECSLLPRKRLSAEPDHASILMLALQSPEVWERNFCCFKLSGLWYFVIAAWTKTMRKPTTKTDSFVYWLLEMWKLLI